MAWTAVSDGGGKGANEDLVAVHEHGAVTDILVLDGGSSVAERNHADPDAGDVAWFVRAFAAALAQRLGAPGSPDALVAGAIDAVRSDYLARSAADPAPVHAWPIAAFTWIRIHGADVQLFCLGDCKTLLRTPGGEVRDLDPWINPQEAVLQGVLAGLPSDPVQRKARLLPLLRARREQQNLAAAPSVLCVQPAGPFAARRHRLRIEPGTRLLAMTDGFYRLSDPYELVSPPALFDACLARGLDAMLAALRAFERAGDKAALSVKAADDASAVLWTFTQTHHPRRGEPMDNATRTAVIERYLAAYNAFDIEGMLAVLTPGVRFENVSGDTVNAEASGIDAFRSLAGQGRQLFSAREQRLTSLEFAGDTAYAGIAWRGTFAVDVPDGPRAGSTVDVQGRSEFTFDGERIARLIDRS